MGLPLADGALLVMFCMPLYAFPKAPSPAGEGEVPASAPEDFTMGRVW